MTLAPDMAPPVEGATDAPSRTQRPRRGVASAGIRALLAAVGIPVSLVPWLDVLDGSWLAVATAFSCVLAAVGALARALGARALAWLAGLLVAVPWLTVATAQAEALGGVVPTRTSLETTGASIAEGVRLVLYSPGAPIPATPDVIGLVLLAVLALWLLVDGLLALGLPALAAAPLLAPVVLPMAYRLEVDPSTLAPTAIAIVAFLVLGRREATRGRAVVVGVAAVCAALVAPAVLPAPREADIPWPRWLQGAATGGAAAGGLPLLSTGIDLGAELSRGAPVEIFQYEPSDGLPTRTRLTALQGIGPDGFVEARGELSTAFGDLGGTGPGTSITTTFTLGRALIGNVPIPVQATSTIDFTGTWRWDPASQSIGFTDPDRVVSLADQTYAVESVRPAPIPDDASPGATGAQDALEVPEDASAFVDLAASIVDEDASPIDRARQLETYLTDDSWEYSESVPLDGFGTSSGGQWSALERFTDARSGYCVHYASAMAILARAADIPARVSIGFLPGTDPNADGAYAVTTNDMHAWAELWFDGYGWVPFDTTPGIAEGGTVASADDDGEAGATEQPTLPSPTAAEPTPSADPSASPSASPSLEPGAEPTPSLGGEAGGPGGAGGAAPRLDLVLRPVLLVLAALAIVLAPATIRAVLRRRRLAEGAGGALFEVQATLADAGRRVPTSATPGEVAAAVAALPLRDAERLALDRLRDAAERERFAGEASTGHAADARLVLAGIGRAIPRLERPLRLLAPASLVRVWGRPRDAEADAGVDALR